MNVSSPLEIPTVSAARADKAHILVADANRAHLDFLCHCLAAADRVVHAATSADAALELAGRHALALALLAVSPEPEGGLDGYALAERLRGLETARQVPVIFLTPRAVTEEHVFQGYASGAVDYLVKPVPIDILLSKVQVFVTLHQQRQALHLANRRLREKISACERAERDLLDYKEQLETMVVRRTRELQDSNRRLQQQLDLHLRMEAALREAEARYRSIFENAVEGIFQTTPDGHYLSVNPALAAIYGYASVDDLLGHLQDIAAQLYVDPNRRAEFRRILEERDVVTDFESQVYRKNGEIIWISEHARAVRDAAHRLLYYEGMVEDISARKRAEAELRELNRAYSRFVPHEFLRSLQRDSILDVRLNDHVQKRMSILFSDIRCFTRLSEHMTPKESFEFVNAYFGLAGPVVRQHGGFIDKYIGDSIMALFERADDAVRAAVAMLQTLHAYNRERLARGEEPIRTGIGINSGSMMLGTVGEHHRMEGTVISDAVNLASRIEKLTKNYGVPLLISESTLHSLAHPERHSVRFIDQVKVKGKAKPVIVYEVFDADDGELYAAKRHTKADFERACAAYRRRDFAAACALFQTCGQFCPQDRAVEIYLERCRQHLHAQPKPVET